MSRVLSLSILVVLASSLLGADAPAVRVLKNDIPKTTTPRTADKGKQRLREGGKLTDVRGRFEFAGERIAFYPADGSDTLPVLENLALERTAQIIQDSRGKQEWVVSGTITEFRGNNYLLLTKAIVKATE